MPEDPAGEPVRVEDLERVGLLAGAQELDRDAGDGGDRERRAAAGVAVDLGQDQAGDRDGGDERLRDARRPPGRSSRRRRAASRPA